MTNSSENITGIDDYGCSDDCYQINVTLWFGPIQMVQPIYGIMLPCIQFATLIFNSLIILVLTRPSMKSATNTVLTGMAACDLVTIILPAPWYFVLYTLNHHANMDWSVPDCYMFELMVEIIPQMFHTASNWLTLALAVQRYIFVCHPTMAKTWCTVTKSSMLVASLISLAVFTTSSRIVDRTYFVLSKSGSPHLCVAQFSSWVLLLTKDIYFNCFYWFRVVCVHLVPCVSLVILNILLFSAIRKAERRRQKLMASRVKSAESAGLITRGSRDNKRQRDANSTTMMLIVVIAVFLSVETPLMVMTALHTISSSLNEYLGKELLDYNVAKTIVFIINLCIYISYPLNFAIYGGMSRQFRDTFRLIIVAPIVKKFSIRTLKTETLGNEDDSSAAKLKSRRASTAEYSRSPNLSTKTCAMTVSQI